MVQINKDKYDLAQSTSGVIVSPGEEIRMDLTLQPNTNNIIGANISGTVTNESSDPIEGAYIKLMTENYEPIVHTITNTSGQYFLDNIAQGNYYLFAIAQGMNLNQGNLLVLKNYLHYTVNFMLTSSTSSRLAIVAGRITDSITNNPINRVIVSLFSKTTGSSDTLISLVYTNEYGQYVFSDVPIGNYAITMTSLEYLSLTIPVSITENGEIYPIKSVLQIRNTLSLNTIVVRGYDYRKIIIIGFNVTNTTLTLQRNYPGTYFHGARNAFFRIQVISVTGVQKLSVEVIGKDTSGSSKLNPINGFKFEYGDKIKLWCSDPQGTKEGALIITGKVINGNEDYSNGISTSNMNNTEFQITPSGLKAIYLN
ncbi:carboxypeptidase regulatory-like domain-containing protein (plasmid) [Clostridium novyi]|uniref:carboxypeptidase-like regulatory domain-containing protein n=1 Tax=Clostridium novyi TaxID=1542 RepID=UPI000EA38DF3|nr:carboxypeptidase-like regulatory domain-containing protein [Clostridium novyi]AYF55418.1 carboxypeptidase regulatory-like domain-containing protein [Clostridium novyi]